MPELYKEEIDQTPGTYWFTDDYMERMGTMTFAGADRITGKKDL